MTDPEQIPTTATPRPGDPEHQPTDPESEGNPLTHPNPVEGA
jgi:hypothetical protein